MEVVQPDSHYFSSWIFTTTATPLTGLVNIPVGTSNTDVSFAGRTLTITNINAGAANVFALRRPNPVSYPGNLPANIDFNLPANSVELGASVSSGQSSLTSTQPLSKGTVLFFGDVDGQETADIRFYDCSANMVDAGGFTFLQVSETSATSPPNYSLQVDGVTSKQYWNIQSLNNGDDPGSINGIIINSDQVCGIQLSTVSAVGGSFYSLGMPAAPYLNATKSVAHVNGSASQTRVTQPQDTVDYAITIRNTKNFDIPVPAGAIQDSLPAGLTFASSADFTCPPGLPCSNLNGVTVAANSSITLHITATVDSGLSRTATPALTNTVAITNLNCAAAGNQCSVTTLTSPPGATAAAVPTNSPWSLALLAALLAAGSGYAFRRVRSSTLH